MEMPYIVRLPHFQVFQIAKWVKSAVFDRRNIDEQEIKESNESNAFVTFSDRF